MSLLANIWKKQGVYAFSLGLVIVAFEGDQAGTVTAQDPKYGVSVAKGSEVMLTLEIPEKTDTTTDTTGTQTTQ